LLQSPDFLYQFAKPKSGEVAGHVVPLDDYELASRLAFFVWDSLPDDGLFAAAAAGGLSEASKLESELTRMMADPRFDRGTASFYSNWLRLHGFRQVARDDPGLTSEVIDALKESLLKGATSVYATAAPNIHSLFTGQTYYLNDRLRAFYGLSGGGPELAPTELSNEERRGLLTHPGLLTLLARPDHSDPIARGLFVQRTLLCNDIPLPPPDLEIPELPSLAPGLSTRARLEQHTEQAACAACHSMIDPPGFALEAYSEVGRFRSEDHGVPVNTSGEMPGDGDVAGPFAGGGELLDRLAASADVKRCFAEHYLRFAVARGLEPEDTCARSKVAEDFVQTGDLKQLIAAVAKSDAFRLRATETQGVLP
jgi:hypothetical protein